VILADKDGMSIVRRGSTYHLKRRVPKRYRTIEHREFVYLSLKTDSKETALAKAKAAWERLIDSWEARLVGNTEDAELRYEAARDLARARGYRFMSMNKIVQLPLPDVLDRIEAAQDQDGKIDLLDAEALLGGAQQPKITVSRALDIYLDKTADRRSNWDTIQKRIFLASRQRAVQSFIDVVGDLPIDDIDSEDALRFRDWWWERIERGEVKPNTANRQLSQLSSVLNEVIKLRRLKIDPPLRSLQFKEGKKATRLPFSTEWIRSRILAPGALDGLNLEARCILLGMINTGYRPSEGANLTRSQIHLEGNIPYIEITPEVRDLKTVHSERVIPLAGVSLEAFRACPDGFPRYRGNSGPSALINKFLRNNGLCETPKHTLYGLRHSFEDRMLEARIDERLRRDFLGHKLDRERYGQGGSLEFKMEAIQAVAL